MVGAVNDILAIDADTGEITVKVDNAFDYDRQREVIVQVVATDTLGAPTIVNNVYAQLIVTLNDINNKRPEIIMVRIQKTLILPLMKIV
jgi:hypothetical protein